MVKISAQKVDKTSVNLNFLNDCLKSHLGDYSQYSVWCQYKLNNVDDMNKNKHIVQACLDWCAKNGVGVFIMPPKKCHSYWGMAYSSKIELNPNMPAELEAFVFVHEIAHILAGHCVRHVDRPTMKKERELIAESIAYLVFAHFGINKINRVVTYVASHIGGSRLNRQKSAMTMINRQRSLMVKTANKIIEELESVMVDSKAA